MRIMQVVVMQSVEFLVDREVGMRQLAGDESIQTPGDAGIT